MGGQAWWRHLVLNDWQKSQRDKRNFRGARGRQREQTPTPWGAAKGSSVKTPPGSLCDWEQWDEMGRGGKKGPEGPLGKAPGDWAEVWGLVPEAWELLGGRGTRPSALQALGQHNDKISQEKGYMSPHQKQSYMLWGSSPSLSYVTAMYFRTVTLSLLDSHGIAATRHPG